jgi:hypothetical protein
MEVDEIVLAGDTVVPNINSPSYVLTPPNEGGTTLTCPCTRCPVTVSPGVSSSPCISGPNGSISPVTSVPNSQVDLFQVYPL